MSMTGSDSRQILESTQYWLRVGEKLNSVASGFGNIIEDVQAAIEAPEEAAATEFWRQWHPGVRQLADMATMAAQLIQSTGTSIERWGLNLAAIDESAVTASYALRSAVGEKRHASNR
jgi:hypothetical protein